MRPKLLEIEGLQSFAQPQKINFELLGETGLFGIFGPTGSGKSTILDAITFALYGRVKRAESGTQGIINTNMNTARVAFTFELTVNGARRTYRVERIYQRKSSMPNSCEPKVVRLIEVTEAGEIPVLDKASEVSNYIKDLLGLSHEDFTRAVVLPQNSFNEFLLLTNKERRGMLERIFYLEEYGKKLTDKVNMKIAGLKSKLDVLSGELKGYQDATDEALEEARKALEKAITDRDEASEKLKELTKKYEEAKEVWGLLEELKELDEKEEKHLSINHVISEKRQRLEKAQKAEGILDQIRKNRELEEKLSQTEEKLRNANEKLREAEAGLMSKKAENDLLKSKIAVEAPRLMELKTRLSDAIVINKEIEVIEKRINELSGDISELTEKINTKKENLNRETAGFGELAKEIEVLKSRCEALKTDPEYRQQIQRGLALENRVNDLEEDVEEIESRLVPLRDTVSDFQQKLDSVRAEIASAVKEQERIMAEMEEIGRSAPEDRNEILKGLEEIHNTGAINEVLKLRAAELVELRKKICGQEKEIEEAEKKKEEFTRVKNSALEEYKKCMSENEAAFEALRQSSIYELAEKLTDGEPCPVCGSTTHPMPAAPGHGEDYASISVKAEEARKKLDKAAAALKSAEGNLITICEQLKAKQEQFQKTLDEIGQKEAQYSAEEERLPESFRGLSPERISEEIEALKKEYDGKLKAIGHIEAERKKYEDELDSLKDIIAKKCAAETGIAAQLKVTVENAMQAETDLENARKALEEAKKEYEDFLQKYGISGAQAELNRLSGNDRQLDLLQKKLAASQEEQEEKRKLIDKLKEEFSTLGSEKIKLEAEVLGLKKQREEKEKKIRELAGDADIGGEAAKVDEKLNAYSKLEKELEQDIEKLEKAYNELKTEKSLLENSLIIYSDDLKTLRESLLAELSDKGFENPDDAEKASMPRYEQDAIKKEIEEYDRVLINIQAQKKLIKNRLKSRSITREEWKSISTRFNELSDYHRECVSQSMVAEKRYEELSRKNEQWKELCKNFSELNHKKGLFEQIQKLLKADHRKDNSFIDYIAQERLRYVAAKASEILGVMTRYRYALEVDAEAGFIVRDDANGGAHRAVRTLSGGETFLASFSLALALSEQLQQKGQSPLEFFFLDEGFGTLDSELLNNVIDALERLSCKDRVIGLISHVPELKSRISRRLIVEPPALQGDGSKVKIEKA